MERGKVANAGSPGKMAVELVCAGVCVCVCVCVQQAWCQQILVDLIHCLYMYFLSAETVVWKDAASAGQSLTADNMVPINRNISRTR